MNFLFRNFTKYTYKVELPLTCFMISKRYTQYQIQIKRFDRVTPHGYPTLNKNDVKTSLTLNGWGRH